MRNSAEHKRNFRNSFCDSRTTVVCKAVTLQERGQTDGGRRSLLRNYREETMGIQNVIPFAMLFLYKVSTSVKVNFFSTFVYFNETFTTLT